MRFPSSFPGILLMAGLLTGTLDILSASVYFTIVSHGQPLTRLFAYISSGVFGKAAFNGDPAMTAWGLLFHYFIAFSWSFLFLMVYPKITALRQYPIAAGLVYGAIIWAFMQFIVLPLSHVPHGPLRLPGALINMAILMVMIGIPLSLISRRYYATPR
ncbi:MAG: hypothetical protein J7623_09395 [Chitinophaga sp.]|uniref:hypothetical protein n=1 Tax=Chitinophaga sp. TaxID=1869181 RepID=UPI001B2139D0|nr:hypothetical protein [Chitinophaga sp.]MBO9728838.1 hypothetical protein [Chitinophaga sp.]